MNIQSCLRSKESMTKEARLRLCAKAGAVGTHRAWELPASHGDGRRPKKGAETDLWPAWATKWIGQLPG